MFRITLERIASTSSPLFSGGSRAREPSQGVAIAMSETFSKSLQRCVESVRPARRCRRLDLIYDAAGITAIQTSSPIEWSWRDVHAVTPHVIVSTGRYE